MDVFQPLVTFNIIWHRPSTIFGILLDLESMNELARLLEEAHSAHIPYRTAQRLVSDYRRRGVAALVRKKRADDGERWAVSGRLKDTIEGLALQTPMPIDALTDRFLKRSKDPGERPPSYGIVFNIVSAAYQPISSLSPMKNQSPTATCAHWCTGEKRTGITRFGKPITHRSTLYLMRPDGEAAKPWLTTLLDDYSRAAAGYFLSFENSSLRWPYLEPYHRLCPWLYLRLCPLPCPRLYPERLPNRRFSSGRTLLSISKAR